MSHKEVVGVFFDPKSFEILEVCQAARQIADIVWVIDSRAPWPNTSLRFLARFGQVVDSAALTVPELLLSLSRAGVVGVTTFSDWLIALAAEVATELDLPFHPIAVASALVDKSVQRERLAAAGIPVPGFRRVDVGMPLEQRAILVNDIAAPAILKPVSGWGSRSVHLLHSRTELGDALAADYPESMLLEEFLPDRSPAVKGLSDVVSVETVSTKEGPWHFGVTGRFTFFPPMRESGLFFPAVLEADEHSQVLELTERALTALGVRTGVTHTEIKLTPDGPRIIELNGRVGGCIPWLMQALGGPSPLEMALETSLGRGHRRDATIPADRTAFMMWQVPPVGASTITSIDGLSVVSQLEGVRGCTRVRDVGDRVDWREGGIFGNVYMAAGVCNDLASTLALRERILDSVAIDYV